MTVFVIVTLLLVVAALFFVIPPLQRHRSTRSTQSAHSALNVSVYRDQLAELDRDLANDIITEEQHRQGRLELEQRLLEDVPGNQAGEVQHPGPIRGRRTAAIVFGIAVPLFAAVMYVLLGAPQIMTPQAAKVGDVQGGMQDQVYRMVAQLEERLRNDPNDAEGWTMLGRSYLVLEQFDKALPALEHAVSLNDGDAQLLADYADALAMNSGQTLEGRPSELIERALSIDPNNQKALWLAGTAAYERSEYPLAIKYWTRLKSMAPPDSEVVRAMDGNIAEARTLMAGGSLPPSPPPGQVAAAGAGRVGGVVRIADALRSRVKDSDTVFVYARAPQGPRMPLAVMRAEVKDLPLTFMLDDSMAMAPQMNLSSFSKVVVVARISKSGSATPQSGDLQGVSDAVTTGATDTEVVINEAVP
jgi:cytochrome c-type biogenesis protein CcmH